MITIPTWDLTGVIADVLPFASPDKDDPVLNTVRIEWDGDQLHALATDRYNLGWSTWHPDDEPLGEAQDDLFTAWGSGDDPWQVTLNLADAKELVKVFKLPAKEGRAPLTVHSEGRHQVEVIRARETGHSAITIVAPGYDVDYPDIRAQLADHSTIEAVDGISYSAIRLANFGQVRQVAPMELRFTGAAGLTHVSIGKRFVGAIAPIRLGERTGPADG